jgi:hypothetical protein
MSMHYTLSADDIRLAARELRSGALGLAWVFPEAPLVTINHWAQRLDERADEIERKERVEKRRQRVQMDVVIADPREEQS